MDENFCAWGAVKDASHIMTWGRTKKDSSGPLTDHTGNNGKFQKHQQQKTISTKQEIFQLHNIKISKITLVIRQNLTPRVALKCLIMSLHVLQCIY